MTVTVTLSSKGQLVIPKPIREAFGLQQGTRFHVAVAEGKIILEPEMDSHLDTLYGKYAGAALLTDLEAEHFQELEDDAAFRA